MIRLINTLLNTFGVSKSWRKTIQIFFHSHKLCILFDLRLIDRRCDHFDYDLIIYPLFWTTIPIILISCRTSISESCFLRVVFLWTQKVWMWNSAHVSIFFLSSNVQSFVCIRIVDFLAIAKLSQDANELFWSHNNHGRVKRWTWLVNCRRGIFLKLKLVNYQSNRIKFRFFQYILNRKSNWRK